MTPIKQYPPKPARVYFFGTCLIDLFYPEAGLDGIRLLEREGIDVRFPDDQTCCGQPAYTSGYHDEARAVAEAQLDLFREPWPIVVPSGSCGGMIRTHYPQLFSGTPREAQAKEVASRVFELTEFLVHVCHIKLIDKGRPEKVAMHTSCSARREMGLPDTGPALLSQLQSVELVEQERTAECCGFGGTFAVRHPEVSGAMVNDKVQAIESSGAEHFVTSDCGCLMNIAGCCRHREASLDGEHIASYLWRRTA
ncbi:(Fe-S)-binding protein [Aidingimonas halophila]|uniref:L-lactate dehydrogenase complex protein LldE n=1 Tax=Aidingimonas halophila TaxID=574349 RepID=A0A1H3FZF9_9GAMM|nr:(Fe-S)-binding protein [Aidingimonas halophila]GHC39093.1 Fe-S oxidoreductase [Aidingimonas halophila]SDX95564.1 L-lactate dehydrogenase complex protein LldE [Aidingimonas halophila]